MCLLRFCGVVFWLAPGMAPAFLLLGFWCVLVFLD